MDIFTLTWLASGKLAWFVQGIAGLILALLVVRWLDYLWSVVYRISGNILALYWQFRRQEQEHEAAGLEIDKAEFKLYYEVKTNNE